MTTDTAIKRSPELYKLDSKSKTRVWFMEQEGDKYRTYDGLLDGNVKCSAWRTAKPTNVGRSNERDGVAQAAFEIEAAYTKQLKGSYYTDVADIHLGCRYVEPMLAEKYTEFAPGEAQPKLDGFRCVLMATGGQSREGEMLPGARHLVAALAAIFARAPNLKLDGELYNPAYATTFGKLSSLIKDGSPTPAEQEKIERDVQFHAYDIIGLPLKRRERRLKLAQLIAAINNPMIQLVESHDVEDEASYDALHIKWVSEQCEGSMWRPHDGDYEEGKRSKNLRKRKDFDDAEFEIIPDGIEEGEGNWAGAAKRVICWLPGADRTGGPTKFNTFEAGLRGTKPANIKLFAERDQHKIVTIRHFGWTDTEIPKPRFGVATKFWGPARDL